MLPATPDPARRAGTIRRDDGRAVHAPRAGARAESAVGRRGADRRGGRDRRADRRRGLEPADRGVGPDRARRSAGPQVRGQAAEELPADRRNAVRHARALRHVRRRHVPRACRAGRVRRQGSQKAGAEEQREGGRRAARAGMRRHPERLFRRQAMIVIDIGKQTLTFDGKTYPVSTAKNGRGEKNGSFCTPRGKHIVRAKIGAGLPANTVFVRRRPTGELWSPELNARFPGRDWMLTRLLWLSGCEPGFNRLGDVDTMRRYIYI